MASIASHRESNTYSSSEVCGIICHVDARFVVAYLVADLRDVNDQPLGSNDISMYESNKIPVVGAKIDLRRSWVVLMVSSHDRRQNREDL